MEMNNSGKLVSCVEANQGGNNMFDIVTLARIQFAMTTVFHFFFVPFSIGLALVVAIMETMYVVKKRGTLS